MFDGIVSLKYSVPWILLIPNIPAYVIMFLPLKLIAKTNRFPLYHSNPISLDGSAKICGMGKEIRSLLEYIYV